MSRNSKNAKRLVIAREQNRPNGFKGPKNTTPKHGKKKENRSKYNTAKRVEPFKGKRRPDAANDGETVAAA